ncbi:MAG: phenylacetate--CoA ligase [Candidatus Bathyarchaeota archaeon]|nr:phenylacetate--CoA ligase [Candidatus Bathyarchaeota archaeon]
MSDSKYWNKTVETMPRKQLRELQYKKLKSQVRHCYDNSPFYQRKFKAAGITPASIKSLDDLSKIPFTVKTDLRDNYPTGLVAVDSAEVVEIHASSGTTGNPIIGAYTKSDMEAWQEIMARSIYTAGGRREDVIHIAYGYGLFTGGLGFHYGAQKVGAEIVPASSGMTQRQIKLMKDLGVTILCCTPSFAVYLAETMNTIGVNPRKDLKLRLGLFGAEPWSERTRQRVNEALGIDAFDVYGLTELCGPGVSMECPEHNGMHIWEDHFIVETIDPETGEVLPEGEEGELVFTPLSKMGMPILRYRTRDISVIETDMCPCMRTHSRMMRVSGRSDDMLIIRGVNVFPSQIEYVIMGFPELATQYEIHVDRPDALDTFAVKVELNEEYSKSSCVNLNDLKRRILSKINNITGLNPEIHILKYGELARTEGKAKHVFDNRKGKT